MEETVVTISCSTTLATLDQMMSVLIFEEIFIYLFYVSINLSETESKHLGIVTNK